MISLVQQWKRHRNRSVEDQGLKFGDFSHFIQHGREEEWGQYDGK